MSRGRLFQLALLLCLTWAEGSVGWADDGVRWEQARNQAAALRTQSAQLRDRQQNLRTELSQVSATIESLKTRSKGKVLREPELEGLLRRSQELSSQLATLARKLSDTQAELQAQHSALLEMLNERLTQLRTAWEKAPDRSQRRTLLTQMKALRMERDQIRTLLPAAAALPALTETSTAGTDDPEELMEQADALRDIEDKVRAQLKRVDGLLAQAREEHAFDRRMDEFLGDEALFDDSDRRLRMQRPTGSRPAGAAATANDSAAPDRSAGAGSSAPEFTSAGGPSAPATPTSPTPSVPSPSAHDLSGTMSAKTGLPQALPARVLDLENPRELEVEQKRLQALAAELNARAHQLETKARSLR